MQLRFLRPFFPSSASLFMHSDTHTSGLNLCRRCAYASTNCLHTLFHGICPEFVLMCRSSLFMPRYLWHNTQTYSLLTAAYCLPQFNMCVLSFVYSSRQIAFSCVFAKDPILTAANQLFTGIKIKHNWNGKRANKSERERERATEDEIKRNSFGVCVWKLRWKYGLLSRIYVSQ